MAAKLLPPVANINAIPVRTFTMGYTMLMAANAFVPTYLETNIPSTIVYSVLNSVVK